MSVPSMPRRSSEHDDTASIELTSKTRNAYAASRTLTPSGMCARSGCSAHGDSLCSAVVGGTPAVLCLR